jgi:hypothetical protein
MQPVVDAGDPEDPFGQRPGLVDAQHVDPPAGLDRPDVADQHAVGGEALAGG